MTKRDVKEIRETILITLFISLFLSAFAGCAQSSDGENGTDGVNGKGCYVYQVVNGAEIKCDGETTAIILNGDDDKAEFLIPIVRVENPCGIRRAKTEYALQASTGEFLVKSKGRLTLVTKDVYCE